MTEQQKQESKSGVKVAESTATKKGFWSSGKGNGFFAWVDLWARWPDVILVAVWGYLIFYFTQYAYGSYFEGSPVAEEFAATLAAVIAVVGPLVRFAWYRFYQRPRRMKAIGGSK